MRKTLLAIALGLTALAAAACGNSNNAGGSNSGGGTESLAPIASPSDMLASPSDMLASPSESPSMEASPAAS